MASHTTSVERKAAGAYFTPPSIVRYILRHTLGPLLDVDRGDRPLRVLEPACGEGGFLAEAGRSLLEHGLQRAVRDIAAGGDEARSRCVQDTAGRWHLTCAERCRIVASSCFGLDIDRALVAATRRELAALAAADEPSLARSLQRALQANIRCGDALLGPDFESPRDADRLAAPVDWQRDFGCVWREPEDGFDAVIGNPPYVNIRWLTRTRGAAVKEYLRAHYACARGAYDLYALFLELAFRVLRPGGLCGMIVPNKLAGLAYAAPCRTLLQERTAIQRIADLSQWRVFPDAGVYPYVIIWQKRTPASGHRIEVVEAASEAELQADRVARTVLQAGLSAAAGFCLHGGLDVESRVATQPLGTLADLHSGTTGFRAAAMAGALSEGPPVPSRVGFPFIVSGNLDRYRIRWGQARFMKRHFVRPVLPAESEQLTDAKRRLFQGPKIVIAGMTRRLEAAWDPGGLALGVQVYAAANLREDRRYLLGLLNSKLFSFLFRMRFRAKQLSGGFLAINKMQLHQLPIRIVAAGDPTAARLRQQLIRCVEFLEQRLDQEDGSAESGEDRSPRIQVLDREIDQCVYRLYELTGAEIALVEADLPPPQ